MLYQRRWSHELLAPEAECNCTYRNLFRFRVEVLHSMCIVEGVHCFSGTIEEPSFDWRILAPPVPIEATLSISLADGVTKGGRQVRAQAHISGHVRFGQTMTKNWHGSTGDKDYFSKLNGRAVDAHEIPELNAARRRVTWHDGGISGSRRIFKGLIDEDGGGIRGTIHLVRTGLPPPPGSKTGTFELHRRPPAEGEPTTIMDLVRKMMQARGVRGA